ncbi:hypothetical protein [Rhizobium sp. BK377]|uniref:hypothetical protein n=1 Tax=Rhizobium sp. BK377 TaxID=2587058 RepID=UPI00160F9EFF|nr:hypothetical protein [Rhizobium sp. BK377]MBB3460924.1 hypothetical protein [Rhizobium sp. BK377]
MSGMRARISAERNGSNFIVMPVSDFVLVRGLPLADAKITGSRVASARPAEWLAGSLLELFAIFAAPRASALHAYDF